MIEIQHIGNEDIISPELESYSFTHDAVGFQFKYDVSKVKSVADCTSNVIFDTEILEAGEFFGDTKDLADTLVPLGPFTMWQIIMEPEENSGLVMNASHVYIELCGGSMAPRPSF
jgi:hypothetical protein